MSEVNALIERFMARFPGESRRALNRYFEAVHQDLAPLARKLEAERDRLRAEATTTSLDLGEVHLILRKVWARELSADDGLDEIERIAEGPSQ